MSQLPNHSTVAFSQRTRSQPRATQVKRKVTPPSEADERSGFTAPLGLSLASDYAVRTLSATRPSDPYSRQPGKRMLNSSSDAPPSPTDPEHATEWYRVLLSRRPPLSRHIAVAPGRRINSWPGRAGCIVHSPRSRSLPRTDKAQPSAWPGPGAT